MQGRAYVPPTRPTSRSLRREPTQAAQNRLPLSPCMQAEPPAAPTPPQRACQPSALRCEQRRKYALARLPALQRAWRHIDRRSISARAIGTVGSRWWQWRRWLLWRIRWLAWGGCDPTADPAAWLPQLGDVEVALNTRSKWWAGGKSRAVLAPPHHPQYPPLRLPPQKTLRSLRTPRTGHRNMRSIIDPPGLCSGTLERISRSSSTIQRPNSAGEKMGRGREEKQDLNLCRVDANIHHVTAPAHHKKIGLDLNSPRDHSADTSRRPEKARGCQLRERAILPNSAFLNPRERRAYAE